MNDSQKIGELLHYFRMEQKEFAEKCGILPDSISNIKRGKQNISLRIFHEILDAFPEVNQDWLKTGEGEMIKNSVNQSIIGNKNVQVGNHSIVQQGINAPEENKNNDNSNSEITALYKLLAEKDERIRELKEDKDKQIRDLKEEKDKLLAEKDERIRELLKDKEDITKRNEKLQDKIMELLSK